jgi:hypothetical protein
MSSDESLAVRCPRCARYVAAKVCGFYTERDEAGDAQRHALLACPDCSHPFLVKQDSYPLETVTGAWTEGLTPPVVLYPSELTALDPSVPSNIAESYLEARRVFSLAAGHTAAAIMCRRTLEGICKSFSAKGKTLHAMLKDLRERSVIEKRLHEWADDVLRDLGNDAAHDVDVVISREDAQDALDFTRAIIEYLYVFEAAFTRFKARRGSAQIGTTES